MKYLKDLTVLIVTYNTDKKILINCLKSIDKRVKVLIIENSNYFKHFRVIKKFKNTKYICSGKNLGYGKGNNFGINRIKTNYVFIMNPDVVCEKKLFLEISHIIKKKLNFHIIGCQYLKDKIFMPAGFFESSKNKDFVENFRNNKIKNLTKVEWVTGCSMLINLKKFKNKSIFDKNYFLYFEETDLCKSIIKNGGNIFTSKRLKINHIGFSSSLGDNSANKEKANTIREWHWMWSSFYFYKKHYGYFYSFFKFSGKLLKSLIKMIFFTLFKNNELSSKHRIRFKGLLCGFLNKPSNFRK